MALFIAIPMLLRGAIGAETAEAIRSVELDPSECYRVRDLRLVRGDVKFFLTDGYLTFSKPVRGEPVAALFSANADGGDGEILLLPPNRDERRILSARAGNPNLDEHLLDVAFFFADDTAAELRKQMSANEWIHKDEAKGKEIAGIYANGVRNAAKEFEICLLLDLLNRAHQKHAFFAAVAGGKTLGSFQIILDTRSPEQLISGRTIASGGGNRFELWTSYTPKSLLNETQWRDFRADRYRMDSRIDSKLHMHVESTLAVQDLSSDLSALSFQLSRRMRVISATVDDVPAETIETPDLLLSGEDPGDKLFLIVPRQPLRAGVEHSVRVVHEGDVITAGANHVYFVGSRGRWYPHRDLEFARFEMRFRFPKALDLVAPGDPVLDMVDGDERVITRRSDVPLPMAGFNLGNYDRSVVKRGDFTIEVCSNRGDRDQRLFSDVPPASVAGSALRREPPSGFPKLPVNSAPPRAVELATDIADVMDFYARRFGPPPLKRLIVSPIPARFGQGFGGLIYLSTMAYQDPLGGAFSGMDPHSRLFFTQLMDAHEVAHQWWGNLVVTSSYHDEWIMEALANYSAMLYLEKRSGPRVVRVLMDAYRDGLLERAPDGTEVESAGPVTEGRRIEVDGKPGAWVSVVYGKGTWIISMLHARMGDASFWTMLGELRRRYERKSITTDQFRQLCAEFMPKDSPDRKLEAFFDQWVWGMGIPALHIASSSKSTGAAAFRVNGTLSQKDVPDDFSADFPIEVQVHGKTLTKWVRSSSDPVPFSLPVNAIPQHVELDPENRFLRR